ncbi:Cytochrome P450 [Vigna unguiculata]|uniref:Cytochrome P450 n=1 Tax=Vigna unguiculata TaxID=3917 RepID=A0A4D6MF68_VIGUN|nr:Cytochrome P450 [Vigna unguiculata]
MDSEILFVFSFLLCMIVALKLGRNLKKKTKSSLNIPPGPWKLPIIGNLHHLLSSTPHRKLRDLAKIYGPMMHLQLGEIFIIVVSSAEYAKEIMKTHDAIFASRPQLLAADIASYGYTNIAFAPYGSYWKKVRRICTMELLSPKRVSSFQPIREEELSNLVEIIGTHVGGSPINLTEAVSSSMYNIISRAALGKKRTKDQDEFMSILQRGVVGAGGFDIGELFPSATWLQHLTGLRPMLEKVHQEMDRILEAIIDEHREARSKAKYGHESDEDLVDVLLNFHDANDTNQEVCLTINNIKAVIMDIFVAGVESVTTTVNWAMAEMIKNPSVMKKAQAEVREVFKEKGKVDEMCMNELQYLKSVVKETLRLHPPGTLLVPRECAETCEIDGYDIPVKSKVLINAWAIGRDPKYWNEAERFYPERFIGSSIDLRGSHFEFIPFGAGRRMCPGMSFGLLSVELTLAVLLFHFDWNLPNGIRSQDFDMSEKFGVTVGRKNDIFLIPLTASTSLGSDAKSNEVSSGSKEE